MTARRHGTRLEDEVGAAEGRALDLRVADRRGGEHAAQVLRLQAGLRSPAADVAEVKRLAGEQRQRQAGAEDLPAALAEGAVQFQELAHGAITCVPSSSSPAAPAAARRGSLRPATGRPAGTPEV